MVLWRLQHHRLDFPERGRQIEACRMEYARLGFPLRGHTKEEVVAAVRERQPTVYEAVVASLHPMYAGPEGGHMMMGSGRPEIPTSWAPNGGPGGAWSAPASPWGMPGAVAAPGHHTDPAGRPVLASAPAPAVLAAAMVPAPATVAPAQAWAGAPAPGPLPTIRRTEDGKMYLQDGERRRWLHRQASGGADDWLIVSCAAGDRYLISPCGQAAPRRCEEVFAHKRPRTEPRAVAASGVTGASAAIAAPAALPEVLPEVLPAVAAPQLPPLVLPAALPLPEVAVAAVPLPESLPGPVAPAPEDQPVAPAVPSPACSEEEEAFPRTPVRIEGSDDSDSD